MIGPGNPADDDPNMQIAIAESMRTGNTINNTSFEPLDLKDQLREAGVPVGLKNIGNTCYFNSLLQTYFQIPPLVELVLSYNPKSGKDDKSNNNDFLLSLKNLFASLIKSNKKYQSTHEVIANLKNEVGQPIKTGDQEDVAEFHMNFLNCLLDSLKPKKEEAKAEENKEANPAAPVSKPEGHSEEMKDDSALEHNDNMAVDGQSEEKIQTSGDANMEIQSDTSEQDKAIQLITTLFLGKIKQVVSYELEGEIQESHSAQEFKFVYLDSHNKDLYSAWEKSFIDELQGYNVEEKKVSVNAETRNYFTDLPQVIFFIIKRITYDKEEKTYAKNNEAFEFEDVIYPDRFMIENRKESDTLRGKVNELRDKVVKLKDHIESFQNYNGK